MIISRTPLRVSFCGGGSDLPYFYREHGGAVLGIAIQRYVYLSMHEYFESDGFILKYSNIEKTYSRNSIQHRIIREVFEQFELSGVDFNSSADVPAGTGMGSSSAFTVGLLNLCNAYRGRYESRLALAERACEIEIDRLGEPIGKQDQYSCAIGGLKFLQFHQDDTVTYESIATTQEIRDRLEQNLVMFYLGGQRSAGAVLSEQASEVKADPEKVRSLRRMVDQAHDLRVEIVKDADVLGPFLHDTWMEKRSLSRAISSAGIDSVYDRARAAGATGGKLLGAGAGGFLLVYCPDGGAESVRSALSEFSAYQVRIDSIGSSIIYSD